MDSITGTTKGDLFIAENTTTKTTASAADTLDGGKGVDTFKLYDANVTTAATLPTLKNIENVVLYDNTAALTGLVDLAKWDSVETLFLVREAAANTYTLGEKVTTVNVEDTLAANSPTLEFNDAVAAATIGVNKVGTAATTGGINNTKTWFQYAGNTYVVDNVDGTNGIDATDVIVKLNGLVDLSNSSFGGTDILTIA